MHLRATRQVLMEQQHQQVLQVRTLQQQQGQQMVLTAEQLLLI
jgi:hypothetical protein